MSGYVNLKVFPSCYILLLVEQQTNMGDIYNDNRESAPLKYLKYVLYYLSFSVKRS